MEFPWWLSGKESICQCRRVQILFLSQEDPLDKELATHFRILAWEIPQEESGRRQPMGSLKSRTWLSNYTTTSLGINGQTVVPVLCSGTDQKKPWESTALSWTWQWIWTCSTWRLLLMWVVVEMPTSTEYIPVTGDLSDAFLCSHKI